MLSGSYERKNLKLPKEFREIFGEELLLATSSKRGENCIFLIFLKDAMRKEFSDLLFWGGVKILNNGEVKIPRVFLKKLSKHLLQEKETVIFVGCLDRVEIWRKEDWEEYNKTHNYEEILEKIFYYE